MIARVARYSPAARLLHWLAAFLVLVVWPMGMAIGFTTDEARKLTLYMLHESLGMAILWVMLARLAFRLLRPPPELLPMPRWQKRLANTVHWALYAVLILQPIFGFLATNAFGFPLDWFWTIPLPSPVGENHALAPILMGVHVALGYTILALFVLHMAGVLYHTLLRRDGTLRRMA
ncbi:cytochrome b [Aureimonas mangrovi]|uniref:cytochrome b n=1 Tax=Aureimonas mangrovi TaxID=2758041 RepID=UPI00163DA048|nr:cytochrome b/b6 domain-containing protein [Aureimonas mangrovi]